MAARRKKAANLGELADQVNEALANLYAAGFEDEVNTIRAFIHAEGDFFRNSVRVNRQIQFELSRQIKDMQRNRTSQPVGGDLA